MLIRRAERVAGAPVAMDGADGVTMRMMVGRDDGAPNFAMRHFTVAPGGHTPRHSHNYEHEVVILRGAGTAENEGELHDIAPGDVLFVEPNRVHQFRNTGDEPLEFLCLVPVSFDCGDGAMTTTPGS